MWRSTQVIDEDEYYQGRRNVFERSKSVVDDRYDPVSSTDRYYRSYSRSRQPPSTRRSPPYDRSVSRSRSVGPNRDYSTSAHARRHVTPYRESAPSYQHHRRSPTVDRGQEYGTSLDGRRPDAPRQLVEYNERRSSGSGCEYFTSRRNDRLGFGDGARGRSTSLDEHSSRRNEDYRRNRPNRDARLSSVVHPAGDHLSSSEPKKLFLAVNKKTFGMMMDAEYSVFDIAENKDDSFVTPESSWTLRMAMYPTSPNDGNSCSTKYFIRRYTASKGFVASVLTSFLKQNTVKLFTTVKTSRLMNDKSYAGKHGALKEEIARLKEVDMYDVRHLRPQRRSSVCLFRSVCVKRQHCVYCQLEALNNYVNVKSGLRATKDTDVSLDSRSFLGKIVHTLVSKNRPRSASPSSSKSSSSSSSSSASSSDEDDGGVDVKKSTPVTMSPEKAPIEEEDPVTDEETAT